MEDSIDKPGSAATPEPDLSETANTQLEKVPSSEVMPPPSLPGGDENVETRSARSASTTSRSTNRLSLTLPIAPPNPWPSRPTPSSSAVGSCPPTPLDACGVISPTDPGDFITAIAAQERRVLELREELICAEKDLSRLKKQWAYAENHKKKTEHRRTQSTRPLAPPGEPLVASDDPASDRRSVEVDRRKAWLLQQSAQSTPPSRRRVFNGSHARALSLLSPTKTDDNFSVHEDDASNEVTSPSKELDSHFYQAFSKYAPATPGQISKRASWTPRSAHQPSGLRQVADDFRTGLWTFVEDLRQATVGEEPITGAGTRSQTRPNQKPLVEDQNTIRASGPSKRAPVAKAFAETPSPSSRFAEPLSNTQAGNSGSAGKQARKVSSKTDKRAKHFSWTPLTVDSYDDQDWSNWDSPTVLAPTGKKSARWSGSTVNADIIAAGKDEDNENENPMSYENPVKVSTPILSPRISDLNWPVALDKLSPTNLKRTATDLMKEWEKTMASPSPLPFGVDNGHEHIL